MKKLLASLLSVLLLVFSNACSGLSTLPSSVQNDFKPIMYYYMALPGDDISPTGSVTILPDQVFLSPVESNQLASSDIEADLRKALEAMVNDAHNNQVMGQVTIASISFSDGRADIALQGDLYAAGDIILIAVRMTLLLTVFSDASIETASITLNGKNIANLGISFSGEAKPENYVYTRSEINEFMAENAYANPR